MIDKGQLGIQDDFMFFTEIIKINTFNWLINWVKKKIIESLGRYLYNEVTGNFQKEKVMWSYGNWATVGDQSFGGE